MNSLELIREHLAMSRDRVLARVEEMRAHAVVFPTPNGGCHTLWVLGHLTHIEALVVRTIMLGEPNPLAEWEAPFDGTDVAGDHWYMHRGHLADARRAAGLERMWV